MKLKPLSAIFALALLAVLPSSHARLRIDFNDRSDDRPVNTQEDFDAFILNSDSTLQTVTNTLRFGTITVSVWSNLGNGLDDRQRPAVTNSVNFTNAQILQDFIFNQGATSTNSGLSIRVQGLASNQTYQFTISSFDAGSRGNRVSDWFANGALVRNNHTFNGDVLPTSNTQYQFSFNAAANSMGEVLIQGRRDNTSVDQNNAAATGVFLNALEINSIPDQSPACGTTSHFQPGSNLYGWTGGNNFAEQDLEVARLKEIGAKWVRVNVVWHEVEPTQKGLYNTNLLDAYDHLMQRFSEAGIKVIFVTAQSPFWASADPNKTNTFPSWNANYKPANNSDLADYFVFLLNQYRSSGPHAFEIWNEQNHVFFWPSGVDAADYFNMLRTCYNAIKAADPQAIVLNGGLTDDSTSTNFMTITTNYITALYAAGAKPYFDAWSQHTYTKTPQYETIVSKVRNIMVANGDAGKKIWMTEFGWLTSTNPAQTAAVSHNRQAHYLTNMFSRLASYPYVEVGTWYTSRSYDEGSHEGSFGLSMPDFTRKPAFYAFSNWVWQARPCYPEAINLLGIAPLNGSIARVQFSADPGYSYAVQVSTNFGSWLTLSTNFARTNSVHTFDDGAGNSPMKFYRVVSPPP